MSSFETPVARERCGAGAPPLETPTSRAARSIAKRCFDLAVALAILVLLAPLMGVIALTIALDSPGPILFRQQRTGLGGGRFTILKFRTMHVHQEAAHVQQASMGDKRITRVGGLLRKLSFDEFPQLFNIIAGDMSLIGPRPHALSHDVAWAQVAPRYNDRFRARPGLSGLAQVSGLRGEVHSNECVRRRIEADNFYVDNWSLALDLKILLLTSIKIFSDPKAY